MRGRRRKLAAATGVALLVHGLLLAALLIQRAPSPPEAPPVFELTLIRPARRPASEPRTESEPARSTSTSRVEDERRRAPAGLGGTAAPAPNAAVVAAPAAPAKAAPAPPAAPARVAPRPPGTYRHILPKSAPDSDPEA